MNGSKAWQAQQCNCGSGQPAFPKYHEGRLIHFSCIWCEMIKEAVYKPEMLNDPKFFSLDQPKREEPQ